MEPKPSQRHTDKEVGAALGISAGTYKRLKRIDNATRSDDKEIRLFAEKQMAPLAAGSPSWNGRKPSSGNRKAATMGPKPESERRSTKTDTAIGAALGISAGTYRRLKRIDNATRSELAAWAARHP
ncbi:phiRv1 phage protein [Mycobacterium tuberculosis]|nr:integrase [Mycobacterium tuberculosis]SGF74898.1 phiRv1 phage protein [Mycobacterium tuberculosis]